MDVESQLKLKANTWPGQIFSKYSVGKATLYLFLIWFLPLVAYFTLMFLPPEWVLNDIPFMCMKFLVTILTVVYSVLYFQDVNKDYKCEGLFLGFYWLLIFAGINFTWLLVSRNIWRYAPIFAKVYFTEYAVILLVPIAMGYLLEKKAGSE